MKVHLMYRDADFGVERALPANADDLRRDLELDTLLDAMGGDDEFVREAAAKALLTSLDNDRETVLYRQAVLRDCLAEPELVRRLYRLSLEPFERRRRGFYFGSSSQTPHLALSGALHLLGLLRPVLVELANFAAAHQTRFRSEGFRTFFATIRRELDPGFFEELDLHRARLKFPQGMLAGAGLGRGNTVGKLVLRRLDPDRWDWIRRFLRRGGPRYSFELHPRDEAGAQALQALRDRIVVNAADTLCRATEHVLDFFRMLRAELAFYIGCLRLHERLEEGGAVCFPEPVPAGSGPLAFEGLRDATLALKIERVVPNDLDAAGARLVVVTGANQGGKSTFLRSIGVAQLMMQAGMFVAAERFTADLCDGLFTHYRREEDPGLRSGKFDEELRRMSRIVDQITDAPLILFNESFAATNEREGSEVARQIVTALLERGVRVVYVTHMYHLAHVLAEELGPAATFLRAERAPDGSRSFRLKPGAPERTSYARDLYREILCEQAG